MERFCNPLCPRETEAEIVGQPINTDEGCHHERGIGDGEILAQQCLLRRLGDDENQNEVEGGCLRQRPLAGCPEQDEQNEVNHQPPDNGFHAGSPYG